MRRFLMGIALTLIGSIAGAPLGYVWGKRSMGQSANIMSQMYALGEYETLTSLEYQQSDPCHGRLALLDLLAFMQQLENAQGNAIGGSLEIDRAITHMRLALLEEREGNKEKSREDVRQAQDSLRRRPNGEVSQAELREMVLKEDSRVRYALPAVFLLRQAKK